MKRLFAAALCLLLGGCFASAPEVQQQLGAQYIGKNVDSLVLQFGPPASSFRMSTGETSYLWQLGSHTNVDVTRDRYGASGTAATTFCKITVIASPAGIVTRLTTEDGSMGRTQSIGTLDFYGSVCANQLGISKPS
jgi:hypothetical protein